MSSGGIARLFPRGAPSLDLGANPRDTLRAEPNAMGELLGRLKPGEMRPAIGNAKECLEIVKADVVHGGLWLLLIGNIAAHAYPLQVRKIDKSKFSIYRPARFRSAMAGGLIPYRKPLAFQPARGEEFCGSALLS
jgi:hypothetical protein